MKMEPIISSETSAIKTQTPRNYPKRNILQLKHGESLKTRKKTSTQFCCSTWPGLSKKHSERRHDQNAQDFRAIANRVSGDSTVPISTAARRSFNSLPFQPIHSLRSAPSRGPDRGGTVRARSVRNINQQTHIETQ